MNSHFSWDDVTALRERIRIATGLVANEIDLLTISLHERFNQQADKPCPHNTDSTSKECECPVCTWPKHLCRLCMMQVAADAIVDFYEELMREPEQPRNTDAP